MEASQLSLQRCSWLPFHLRRGDAREHEVNDTHDRVGALSSSPDYLADRATLGGAMSGETYGNVGYVETAHDKDEMIKSLLEANQILKDEIDQLRKSNRTLRQVHRTLRGSNESLRRQIETATFNDDMFKRYCEGEFDAKGTHPVDGGLPESGS